MNGLVLLLCCIIPREDVAEDRFGTLERNHFHDDQGRLVFEQLICWRFCPSRETEICEAWRFIKSPRMIPEYDWRRGEYVTRFLDGEVLRQISAPCYRESWTQECNRGDPELRDRDKYPKELRSELRKEPPTAALPR